MNKLPSLQLFCGMEIHAELKTQTKMFCSCRNNPFHADQPNSHVCPVCLGMPGALPVPNQKAIEWTIKLGLALHCEVHLLSKFDRKHYFYPDLPKGYQISQYDMPFCTNGYLDTQQGRVGIRRIHLEEDTAKLQHTSLDGEKVSLIDFNRSSVPLVEIVTEPDIHSTEQATEYAKAVRDLIRYLEIGDCDMEQGGMRLEANLSLSTDQNLPDYKVELKNINSFRFMAAAIEFEVARQTKILSEGRTPAQETRGWDSIKVQSFVQRSKEEAEDYRYFPDPDIPPIELTQAQIEVWRAQLPQPLHDLIKEWQTKWQISPAATQQLCVSATAAQWYQALWPVVVQNNLSPAKVVAAITNKKWQPNWLNSVETEFTSYLATQATTSVDASDLVQLVAAEIAKHPTELARYRAGEQKLFGYFVGQVKQNLPANTDPAQLTAAIRQQLDQPD